MTEAASAAPAAPNTAAPSTTAGVVTAPAPVSTPSPTAPSATTESVNPGAWMAGFNDDQKAFVTNKGYKGPADIVDSYRNAEKMLGAPKERLMVQPEKMYDDKGALTPEGRQIFERMGTPKEAKDYKFPEGTDAKMNEWAGKTLHELGIPKAQGEQVVQKFADLQKAMATEKAAQNEIKFKTDVSTLKQEWGAAHDQNIGLASEAAKNIGLTGDQINAVAGQIGHAEAMKLFLKLGKAGLEAGFIEGHRTPTINEPSVAASKINELMKDADFGKRLMSGDHEAKALWQRLHEQKAAGRMIPT